MLQKSCLLLVLLLGVKTTNHTRVSSSGHEVSESVGCSKEIAGC